MRGLKMSQITLTACFLALLSTFWLKNVQELRQTPNIFGDRALGSWGVDAKTDSKLHLPTKIRIWFQRIYMGSEATLQLPSALSPRLFGVWWSSWAFLHQKLDSNAEKHDFKGFWDILGSLIAKKPFFSVKLETDLGGLRGDISDFTP